MIPLTRTRTKSAVNAKFRDAEPRERLVDLMKKEQQIQAGTLEKHKFPSKWGSTKAQLQKETNGKCAYCETTTTESMHGDVEHYRPKSKYWWLAYVYDNYLASCQLCNQKFKKAEFRIKNQMMPGPKISVATTEAQMVQMAASAIADPLDTNAVEDFEDDHREERPLILNPYVDDPTKFFAWKVREDIGEVDLVPRADNPDAADYVDAAVDLLGLNRPELRERRFAVYRNYKVFAEILEHGGLPAPLMAQVQTQVETAQDAKSPYAGMIRHFEAVRTGG
ncbi:MAG: hypothetical protein AAGC57_06380 [Pseudomonadota bacterium]